jgi:Family of unknown function (DUF6502)
MQREKSMLGSGQRRRTTIDRRRAKSLLGPIAAFLREGGFTKRESLAILSSAFDGLQKRDKNRRMQHIGHPTAYADIIAAWTRNKEYIDSHGRPRALPLSGPKGFATLVRNVSPHTSARTVLSVLVRYRNVRRLKDGKYSLVKPFFYTNSDKTTAFEPIAYFLSDASATLSQILKRQRRSLHPERFWRKVESIYVSESIARQFAAFARDRSFLFLEELDDWLEAHRDAPTTRTRRRRRVGLGLFSIYSDDESASTRR